MKSTRPYWLLIVASFCASWAVIWMYRSMLSPLYPEIMQTVGPLSNQQLGLISSTYFFSNALFQIPSGFLVQRFGAKRVLIPGFIMFIIGMIILSNAQTIGMIYLSGILAGIGTGCHYSVAFSLTVQYVPEDKKGLGTALVNSGSALGMIMGMIGSSFFVKQLGFHWHTMGYIAMGLAIGMTAWFYFKIKSEAPETNRLVDLEVEKTETSNQSAMFQPSLLVIYCLYFGTCYAYYMLVTWLPNFLEIHRGIQGEAIGLIVSMQAVASVPGAIFFARVSDRRPMHKTLIVIGLSILSLILLFFAIRVSNAFMLGAILLSYGFFGKLALDPVLISYVTDLAHPDHLSTTLGVFNFSGMSASVVAPLLTGFIIDMTGSGEFGFYVGIALLLFGLILFMILRQKEVQV